MSLSIPALPQSWIDPDRVPYKDGALWGYANECGTVVIQPAWSEAGFFHGGRARVQLPEKKSSYALIDRSGAFIIPPNLNWHGRWSGWASTGFNISDSAGRYGVVDSNGVVRIAPRFQPYQSNFRFSKVWNRYVMPAKLGGCVGLIDTAGEILIPFEYDWIGEPALDAVRNTVSPKPLYTVEMSDYMVVWKDRKKGVINSGNQIVLPFGEYPRLTLQYPRWTQAQDIDGKTSFFDHKARLVIGPRFTGVEVFDDRYFLVSENPQRLPGESFANPHYGLLDTNDRIVLPIRYSGVYTEGRLLTVRSDDTQFVRTGRYRKARSGGGGVSSMLSDDRPLQFIRELDYATLEPVSEWKLQAPGERSSSMPCGFSQSRRFLTPKYHLPFQLGHSGDFSRGGIIWHPVHGAGPGQHLVYGTDSGGRQRTAIVDNRGDLILGPIDGRHDLWYYNKRDGLFISERPSARERGSEPEYAVLDEWFRPLTGYRKLKPAAAVLWKGAVYFLTVSPGKSSHPGNGHDASYTLTDSLGNAIVALAPYAILGFFDTASGLQERGGLWNTTHTQPGFDGQFLVCDSAGRPGVVGIDGRVRLPAISFGHETLETAGGGTCLAGTTNDRRWLHADGSEVLPGLGKVERLESVETMQYNLFGRGKPWLPVPGLLKVTISGNDGKPFWFYALPNGIAFCSGISNGRVMGTERSKKRD